MSNMDKLDIIDILEEKQCELDGIAQDLYFIDGLVGAIEEGEATDEVLYYIDNARTALEDALAVLDDMESLVRNLPEED